MKTMCVILAVVLGVTFGFATPSEDDNNNVNWTKAEQNYIQALKSDNNGVKVSAATYIRKYNLTGAVEELKTLLAKENADNVKMSGALALISIGGDEGRTAIEKALATEENEIVTEFYKSILNNQVISQR